ncbi:MAG: hypothetical protein HY595_01395, partial [Candidatus Omnitrophica bacterium]|nr:hypothetical protein [Candidatus Omnitrophota bacterium]
MNPRRLLASFALSVVVLPASIALAATENEPGPFVRARWQSVSPDGRIEAREAVDRNAGRTTLSFVERSNGRMIWSTTYASPAPSDRYQGKATFFSPNSKTGVVEDTVKHQTNRPLAQYLFVNLDTGQLIFAVDDLFGRYIYVDFSPDGRIAKVEDLNMSVSENYRGSRVDFFDLEAGGKKLFSMTFDGDSIFRQVTAQVASDRRKVTGMV